MQRRSYHQFCGIAHALDVVGERWTLLIVRNLLLGPLRYSDLLRGLTGITTNLLAKRLREMEEQGLLERARGAVDGSHAYRLTARGAALEPVLRALAGWGGELLTTPGRSERVDVEWLLVALRWAYKGGATLRAELVVDGVPYRLDLSPGAVDIARGTAASPDVRIRGSANAVSRLFLGAAKPGARIPAGLDVEGAPGSVPALMDAFVRRDRGWPGVGAH